MKRICVLNRNKIEQKITQELLDGAITELDIVVRGTWEEAQPLLQGKDIALMIIDTNRFDMYHCNLVEECKKQHPTTAILVTTSGLRKDVAGQIVRMGVQDFLLKPYRPEWLLSAVQAMIASEPAESPSKENQTMSKYFNEIMDHLHDFQYKKCVDTAREYLDFMTDSTDNIAEIRANALAFAEGLGKLCESVDPATQWKISGIIESYRLRYDLQGRKYDSFLICEKILDAVMSTMENDKLYKISDEQRILNYIDRRVKQGVSLDEVAEYANMSSCYFSKVFKKIVGVKFITYVTEQRIEIAQQMLRDTDMPVINIAYDLSYSETNYFSKAFKKKVGVTPTEYREHALRTEG